MKCDICNLEMSFGNLYLKTKLIDYLIHDSEQNLFFDEIGSQEKPILIIKNGDEIDGAFCEKCGFLCIGNTGSMNCIKCGSSMQLGTFNINKSVFGKYIRRSYDNLYFTLRNMSNTPSGKQYISQNEESIKVLKGDFYIRAFYCRKCNKVWFDTNYSKPSYGSY